MGNIQETKNPLAISNKGANIQLKNYYFLGSQTFISSAPRLFQTK